MGPIPIAVGISIVVAVLTIGGYLFVARQAAPSTKGAIASQDVRQEALNSGETKGASDTKPLATNSEDANNASAVGRQGGQKPITVITPSAHLPILNALEKPVSAAPSSTILPDKTSPTPSPISTPLPELWGYVSSPPHNNFGECGSTGFPDCKAGLPVTYTLGFSVPVRSCGGFTLISQGPQEYTNQHYQQDLATQIVDGGLSCVLTFQPPTYGEWFFYASFTAAAAAQPQMVSSAGYNLRVRTASP